MHLLEEFCPEKDFWNMTYKLPALYYWHENDFEDQDLKADKSWVDCDCNQYCDL